MAYQYLPLSLSARSIRLLTIYPESDDPAMNEALHGSLKVVNLDNKPSFTALSYVWGLKSQPPPKISLDGAFVDITENCEQALKHLRDRLGELTIWVDSICINQDDDLEKAAQVPLMRDIYAGADEVFCWLGKGTRATTRAVECLQAVHFGEYVFRNGSLDGEHLPKSREILNLLILSWRVFVARFRYFHHFGHRVEKCPDPPLFLHMHEFQRRNSVSLQEIEELLNSDWINRIWTYQELMLACQPVIVRGLSHIHWDTFAMSITLVDVYVSRLVTQQSITIPFTEAWFKLALDRDTSRSLRQSRGPHHVSNTSQQAGYYQTTMPLRRYRSFVNRVNDVFDVVRMVGLILIPGVAVSFGFLIMVASTPKAFPGTNSAYLIIPTIFALTLSVILLVTQHVRDPAWLTPTLWTAWQSKQAGDTNGLIHAICERRATVSRDYNLGVRGLLTDVLQKQLPPLNPSLALPEVFRDLTVQCLRASNSAFVLVVAAATHTSAGPSWVPDWCTNFSDKAWSIGYCGPEPFLPHKEGATCGSSLSIHIDSKQSLLRVHAHRVYDVTKVFHFGSVALLSADARKTLDLENIQNLTEMGRDMTEFYFTYAVEKVEHSSDPSAWRKGIRHLSRFLRQNEHYGTEWTLERLKKTYVPSNSWRRSRPALTEQAESGQRIVVRLFDLFVQLCGSFSSCDGKFFAAGTLNKRPKIGFALSHVEVGDQVFLMSGLRRPIVLRPVMNDRFVLVSPTLGLDKLSMGKHWQPGKEGSIINVQ